MPDPLTINKILSYVIVGIVVVLTPWLSLRQLKAYWATEDWDDLGRPRCSLMPIVLLIFSSMTVIGPLVYVVLLEFNLIDMEFRLPPGQVVWLVYGIHFGGLVWILTAKHLLTCGAPHRRRQPFLSPAAGNSTRDDFGRR